MVGFVKQFPNVLLVVQGQNDKIVWFHGLSDVFLLEEFTEVKVHPCLFKIGNTISGNEILVHFMHDEVKDIFSTK